MKYKLIGTLTLVVLASLVRAQDQAPGAQTVTIPKEQYQKLLDEHQKLLQEMQEMKAFKAQMQEAMKKPAPQQAETDAALDDLEKQLKAVKQMAKDSFPGTTKMLLTGYGSATFKATSSGYGPSQPIEETTLPPRKAQSFFDATFNPIFLWKLSDRLLFEGEMELELGDNGDTSVALEMAHMSYVLNYYMTISGGKFLNPMDYFIERQHMGWVNKMPDKPLAVYDGLVPDESLLGAQVRGGIPIGPTKVGYAFFVANAPNLNTDTNSIALGALEGGNNANFGNHIAVGGRVGFYPIPELELGYGFEYTGVRPADSGLRDIKALLHSVDATYVRESERLKGIINLHAQWIWSQVDSLRDLTGPGGIADFNNNRNGGYVQLAYRPTRIQNKILGNLEPIIRYDMINQKKTPIGFDENRWTLGLDYWIAPSTVVKAAYEFDQQNGQGHSGNAFLLQTVIGF